MTRVEEWEVKARANLCGAHLTGYVRQNRNLRKIDLERASLRDADFRGCNLKSAQLSRADLRRVRLQGADLRCALLQNAWLLDVNLEGADLRGADLTGARLTRVSLKGANLEGATLDGATLLGVNLRDAIIPSSIDSTNCFVLHNTLWGRLIAVPGDTWGAYAMVHCESYWFPLEDLERKAAQIDPDHTTYWEIIRWLIGPWAEKYIKRQEEERRATDRRGYYGDWD